MVGEEVAVKAEVLVVRGMVKARAVATNPVQGREETAFAHSADIKSPTKEVSVVWTSPVLNAVQK